MIVKKTIILLFILIAASTSHTVAMKRNLLHSIDKIESTDTDITIVLNCQYFKVHTASKCVKCGYFCLLHEKPCYKGTFIQTKSCKQLQLLEHKDDLVLGSYHDCNGVVLAIEDLTDISSDQRIDHLKKRLDPNVQRIATSVVVMHDKVYFCDKSRHLLLVGSQAGREIQSREDLKEFEKYIAIDDDIEIGFKECFDEGCVCIHI